LSEHKKFRLALWLSGIYLFFGLASWILPLIAKPEDSLSAIFLVLFAQPWTMLLTTITDHLQVDSFALNMAVLLAGVLVNSWIIYRVFSWLSRRGK
jgi:hypothetical protein